MTRATAASWSSLIAARAVTNLGLIAAGVAFYSFLALVPLLGAMVFTYGLVVNPRKVGEKASRLQLIA